MAVIMLDTKHVSVIARKGNICLHIPPFSHLTHTKAMFTVMALQAQNKQQIFTV